MGVRVTSAQLTVGDATADDGLDKDIIRRIVRRHLERLRYCYERRLVEAPELAGTVEVTFLIGGAGAVVSSSATGVGDNLLETCVADVVHRMQFPRPKRGSLVQVRYPFHFKRAQ
jgi:outer membrane biosynthesis protein TonB